MEDWHWFLVIVSGVSAYYLERIYRVLHDIYRIMERRDNNDD